MNLIVIQWQWLSNAVCSSFYYPLPALGFDWNRKFIMRSELTIVSASNFKTTTTSTAYMNEAIVNNRRNFCVCFYLWMDARRALLVSLNAINKFGRYEVCKAHHYFDIYSSYFSALHSLCPLFQSMDIINCSSPFMSIISHVLVIFSNRNALSSSAGLHVRPTWKFGMEQTKMKDFSK